MIHQKYPIAFIFLLSVLLTGLVSCSEFQQKNMIGKTTAMQMFSERTAKLTDAIIKKDFGTAKTLLKSGADINEIGKQDETTPLIWVAMVTKRDLKALEFMLKQGANPNIRSSRGMSAMSLAASGDSKPLLELLLVNGGDATIEGDPLTKGNAFRRNLLMMAVDAFRDDYFELLLSHGADVNWNIEGTKGTSTVPRVCITIGRFDWLLYFLDKGYEGNLVQLGSTVKNIHVSERMEPYKQQAIQYLKDRGVDMDAIEVY